jgi:arsenite methyltransferase
MNQMIQYSVDKQQLEKNVKAMYTEVALNPFGNYHFEMGRDLALKLGYSRQELDAIPPEAIDSFAGVGYPFAMTSIRPGEKILDLGSGSGMDLFIAAGKTGKQGWATGIDMTDDQLAKCRRLATSRGFDNVSVIKGYIEDIPLPDNHFDLVISNGVINLSPDKAQVFLEMARVLKPGGRFAISDIVTESPLPENVTCNADLWAACIGGALQEDEYCELISAAGFRKIKMIENPQYEFISKSAQSAGKKYGVKSISIKAIKIS